MESLQEPPTAAPNTTTTKALQLAGAALLIVLAAVFVYANRTEVPNAVRAAREARVPFLVLAAALSVVYMIDLAAFHHAAFRTIGVALPFRAMLWLASAAHFLNLIAKSGGFGGLAVYLQDAGRRGTPGGEGCRAAR